MTQSNFIANSKVLKEILNSAMLLKNLNVNTLIQGQSGTGKTTLASTISPEAKIFNSEELQSDIKHNVLRINSETIIVKDIDMINNVELFLKWVKENSIRVLATTTKATLNPVLRELFTIDLSIPPLESRKEDIKPLIKKFSQEAQNVLGINEKPQKLIINTSNNAYSLRKSIYFSYLFDSIGENEIMMLLEKYILQNIKDKDSSLEPDNNIYRDFQYLYEAPLLRAAKKKYKSQLQMAKYLGLNRVTLRKKLETHKDLIQH